MHEGVVALREMALNGLRQGDAMLAEQYFARLLEQLPDDAQALQFVAGRHLMRGDSARAVTMLQAAALAQPLNGDVLHQLGAAQLSAGDLQGAVASLRRGLDVAPHMFVARLRLGIALEQLGESHDAVLAYFGAVNTAQAQGRWLSDDTTAPGIQGAVKHAMRFIDAGRRSTFDAVLQPLRERYGRSELTRVEQCLAIYLGEQPANLPDPRQKPKFLYFPGVPSQPYYPASRFPWQADLEGATEAIRNELLAVLAENQPLEPFLGEQSQEDLKGHLRSSGAQPAAWDAYFFYRHGEHFAEHCARCPRTSDLLNALPLVRIRDHAPETLFSVLRPGTHILPHRGVTNTRLVTHLPLIVPSDCAINVGGEIHEWKEGQCVSFDDTFEHEAWNRSERTRVVMILDSWNPDLTEVERLAVTDLVEAIGDFNRASEVPVPGG
ncbi:MAG TPA: aspartyl/asparaginyl beta-hydroxylase domain-containing protein [Dyella sp.]|uniref:aspartyl/asparaginyl beta-hydroxylase domain-containing protein n=1 Tax=Dyella sp. TaxID=1869338 RepID=UPI002D76ECE1|nr:aspartyl/asparaginyl beta-hydroxylase domain-containing protein [Dyella sp.]HET6553873.1 aspartyl/asparaginyl beta-hydroxylase domain-containing protein [Dyella sp.]